MNNQQWNPGHAINKGYPYERVESRHLFSNRVELRQNQEGHIGLHVDYTTFPQAKEAFESDDKRLIIDFLMDRLFDFQEALILAEEQVISILTEDPFIPEEFGFESAFEPETPQDAPIRVYRSKYNSNITIHRPIGDVMSDDWDPAVWILQEKKEDAFTNTTVKLPCHRIAYALFYGLGVQVEEKTKEESIAEEVKFDEVMEEPRDGKKANRYNVMYQSGVTDKNFTIENVQSNTERGAITAAKFLIETGDYGVELVEFNELTAFKQ